MLATMAYPPRPLAKAPGPDHGSVKPHLTRRGRLSAPTLLPLDPDELSRRLLVLLPDHNAASVASTRHDPVGSKGGPAFTPTKTSGRCIESPEMHSPRDDGCRSAARHGHLEPGSPQIAGVRNASKPSFAGPSLGKRGPDNSTPAYRHIPQVAASQFVRTTSVDSSAESQLAYRMSRKNFDVRIDDGPVCFTMPVFRPVVSPPEVDRPGASTMQRACQLQYERVSAHKAPILTATVEIGEGKVGRHSPPTQATPKGAAPLDDDRCGIRRKSTGSFFRRAKTSIVGTELSGLIFSLERGESGDSVNPGDHRVDWTQSDETRPRSMSATSSPFPRKSDSRWALKRRLGSLTKFGKDELPHFQSEERDTREAPKAFKKSDLFALFKR